MNELQQHRLYLWCELLDHGFTPEQIKRLLFLGWLWSKRPEAAR